jgi:hypothetical protein
MGRLVATADTATNRTLYYAKYLNTYHSTYEGGTHIQQIIFKLLVFNYILLYRYVIVLAKSDEHLKQNHGYLEKM